MELRFFVDETLPTLRGNVLYRAFESSFDFEPVAHRDLMEREGTESVTSLIIAMLQIEVGVETSRLLYVWGRDPHEMWLRGQLPDFVARPGSIKVAGFDPDGDSVDLELGISIELVGYNEWPVIFDPTTGWVRIGIPDLVRTCDYVEFATDTVAAIDGETLTAIWLRPQIMKSSRAQR